MGFRRLSSSVIRQISHSRKLSGPCISMSFSRSLSEAKSAKQGDGNPNPLRFTVERSEKVGQFYVSVVKYPDCTNYEGKKILVTRKAVDSRAPLDPHFSGDSDINCGLVARFEPTPEGLVMAKIFCEAMK